jgi:lipoprotein-releasing system ATP-binding protein
MLEVADIGLTYPTVAGPLQVLDGISFTLHDGDAAVIMGPSGSGKSSLLYILGGLEPPTRGAVRLNGQNPYALNGRTLAAFRNRQVGFVFQDHCLLPQCTVLENVLLPTLVGERDDAAPVRARALIDQVGLGPRENHRPGELSGGERQRAAIARALIREPRLVLCDEPTGNLDADTAETVVGLLKQLHERQRTILVVVTHSDRVADRFDRRFTIERGRLKTEH